jgi:hypothetical protein
LQFSISCTTRQPRGSEVHAVDYHFLTPDEFRQKIAEDAFVEFEKSCSCVVQIRTVFSCVEMCCGAVSRLCQSCVCVKLCRVFCVL